MEQKKAGRRPGQVKIVTESIIELTIDYIAQRLHKHEIKNLLKKVIEKDFSHPTFEKIYTEAKLRIARKANEQKNSRSEAVAYYEHIIRTTDDDRNGIRAQERLDKILGHETISTKSPEDIAREANRILREIHELDEEMDET